MICKQEKAPTFQDNKITRINRQDKERKPTFQDLKAEKWTCEEKHDGLQREGTGSNSQVGFSLPSHNHTQDRKGAKSLLYVAA